MKRLSVGDKQVSLGNSWLLLGQRAAMVLAVVTSLAVAALATADDWKPARPAKPRPTATIERLPVAEPPANIAWQPAEARPSVRTAQPIATHAAEPTIVRTGAVVPAPRADRVMTYTSQPTYSQPMYSSHPVGPIMDRPMQATANVMPFVEDEIVPTPQPQGMMQPQPQYHSQPQFDSSSMQMSPSMSGGNGDIVYQDGSFGDQFANTMGDFSLDGSTGAMPGQGDACSDGGLDPMLYERFPACSLLSFLNEFYVSAGVQAFKGPLDQGRVGNFGFTEALNVSDSLWHRMGIGYQLGARFAESNFNGDQALGTVRSSTRAQTFVTGGFFHRAFYNRGLQYGIVADYLNDNYFDDFNLVQLRYEISWVCAGGNEVGFWGTGGTQTWPFSFNGIPRTAAPVDQNAFFFRRNLNNGGSGRMWAGFTGENNAALFGCDSRVPISNRFEMLTNFNYLIPTQGMNDGAVAEGWGVGINFAFYPGRPKRPCGPHIAPYRALFGVADNATFMTYQTTP